LNKDGTGLLLGLGHPGVELGDILGGGGKLCPSKVTGQETSVGGVEGVDKRVDSGAIGAVRDQGLGQGGPGGGLGVLGFEISPISVEGKVTVGGVVGVDEGVPVGVLFDFFVIVVSDHRCGNGLRLRCGGGSARCGRCGLRCGNFGVERGGFLAGGTDVVAFNDSEAVLAGNVFDGESLAVIADVGILADSVAVSICLFTENLSVFCCKSGSGPTIAGIESLFFQDFGIFGVNCLSGACGNHASKSKKSKHVEFFVDFLRKNTFLHL